MYQRHRRQITLAVLSVTVALCAPLTPSAGARLWPEPKLTAEDAVRSARSFLRDETAHFHSVHLHRGGTPVRVAYDLEGLCSMSVDAKTGEVTTCFWPSRARSARQAAGRRPRIAETTAVEQARAYLVRHCPQFDDTYRVVECKYAANRGLYAVQFWQVTESGVRLGSGAAADVSGVDGDIIAYRLYRRTVKVSTAPKITKEQVVATCKSLLKYEVREVSCELYVYEDAIGDQRLTYVCHATGPATVDDGRGGKEIRDMTARLSVDAASGELVGRGGGDWTERGLRAPFARPVPRLVYVDFRDEDVYLLRRPVLRGLHALISQQLFEALGAKVTFDEPTGKLTLERAEDPMEVFVGSRQGTWNGEPLELPVAPEMVDGIPYLPADLVTKLLDMPVRWDANKNRLHIDCKEDVPAERQPTRPAASTDKVGLRSPIAELVSDALAAPVALAPTPRKVGLPPGKWSEANVTFHAIAPSGVGVTSFVRFR